MTCISVTERVRRNPFRDSRARCRLFDGALDMGFMKVIAPLFPEFRNEGQRGCREEPLPDKLSSGVLVFLLELPGQECASVASRKVLRMKPAHEVHLFAHLRQGSGREWDRAVLLAFPIVDRKQH